MSLSPPEACIPKSINPHAYGRSVQSMTISQLARRPITEAARQQFSSVLFERPTILR
jgi:hypothetical protein